MRFFAFHDIMAIWKAVKNARGGAVLDKKSLGEFIAENRKELKMTQEQLAKKLFVTNKAVSKWENGQSFPDIVLFEPIAKELGVTVAELVACKRDEAPDDASIKDVLALSETVIKKNRSRFAAALIALFIIAVYAAAISWDKFDSSTNYPYVYWQGFYYEVSDMEIGQEDSYLGERVGMAKRYGRRSDKNTGGDSNCADDETDIYTVLDRTPGQGLRLEGTLAVSVGGKYYIAFPVLENLQEYEKFYKINIGKAGRKSK